jgi:ClpP class serine protease
MVKTKLKANGLEARAFTGRGLLAIDPQALDELHVQGAGSMAPLLGPQVAFVNIRGPLSFEDDWFCTYDAIKAAVAAACASEAHTVVMMLDSPGGDVSGCFDAALSIRDMCKTAGKRLVTYTQSRMCSAAYALGCVADLVLASPSAVVGHVGVIQVMTDCTAGAAAMGMRATIVTSGARKADGHPLAPATDAATGAVQMTVDALAAHR